MIKALVDALLALGPFGLFVLSALDGMGLPIPGGVDALVVFLAMKKHSPPVLAITATIASIAGNYVLFRIARKGGEVYLHKHTLSRGGAHFRKWFQHYGLLTVFIASLVPLPVMPMKIFVVCSGALGVRTVPFLLTFVGGRVPRYFGLAYLGAEMGTNALVYLRQHAIQLFIFAALLFALLFALVKIADYRRARRLAAGPARL